MPTDAVRFKHTIDGILYPIGVCSPMTPPPESCAGSPEITHSIHSELSSVLRSRNFTPPASRPSLGFAISVPSAGCAPSDRQCKVGAETTASMKLTGSDSCHDIRLMSEHDSTVPRKHELLLAAGVSPMPTSSANGRPRRRTYAELLHSKAHVSGAAHLQASRTTNRFS